MVNKKTSCLPSKSAALTVSALVSLFALFATGSEDLSATTAKRSEARCNGWFMVDDDYPRLVLRLDEMFPQVIGMDMYTGRYDSPMGAATLSGAKTTAYLRDNTPDVRDASGSRSTTSSSIDRSECHG